MFIVVEGADGVGKTTLISKLVKKLIKQKANVLQTQEPYDDTDMGHGNTYRQIQTVLKDLSIITPLSRWRLFTNNQSIHFSEVLTEALEALNCDYVICDRFVPSTVVYYTELSVKEALENELKHGALWHNKPAIMAPDLYIHMTLSTEATSQRLKKRKRTNPGIVDAVVDPTVISERYRELFRQWPITYPPVLSLDASRSVHVLTQECLEAIKIIEMKK